MKIMKKFSFFFLVAAIAFLSGCAPKGNKVQW